MFLKKRLSNFSTARKQLGFWTIPLFFLVFPKYNESPFIASAMARHFTSRSSFLVSRQAKQHSSHGGYFHFFDATAEQQKKTVQYTL
jgi:hypothetical protein